jgi:hypothetical protein
MMELARALLLLCWAAVVAAAAPPPTTTDLRLDSSCVLPGRSHRVKIDDNDGELHVFWGMAGDGDLRIPGNNCSKCFVAGNFIRSAPANVQVQPSARHPQPSAGCPACEPPIPATPGWRDLTPFSKEVNRTVNGGANPWNRWNNGKGGLTGAPVGRRTMSFDGGAPCGNHHPQDNLFAKLGDKSVCKNAQGQLTNWSGLWWDHGIKHLKKDWTDFLVALKASGGEWDVITVDTECNTLDAFGVTSLQLRYNPAMTEECSLQHFDAIQNDSRFPAILKQLKANGFVVNGSVSSSPHWLANSLIWDATQNFNRNMAAWQAVMTVRTAQYKTEAYFEPAVAMNPATVLSDYDDVTWSTHACSLDQNGFWQNGCNHANNTAGVAGNRQGPDFYGWMHNVSDKLNFPGSEGTLGRLYNITSFDIAPFNAVMWEIYKMRMYVLTAPSIKVKPWIAYRSYAGDGGFPPPQLDSNPVVGWAGTDYYQEAVMHLALLGADDFLLFNPRSATCNLTTSPTSCCTLADNEMYSKIFTELTAIVGFKKRNWIPEPTPGGWRCGHMLSGMTTPRSRVWRYTSSDGKPHAHISAEGGSVTLTTQHGDGSVATITFSQATVVVSPLVGTPAVSAVGLWINQSLAAALPTNWQCAVN